MRKVRTVQFTSDDLLIFTESVKHVHVVDMRNKVHQGKCIQNLGEVRVPLSHHVNSSPNTKHD